MADLDELNTRLRELKDDLAIMSGETNAFSSLMRTIQRSVDRFGSATLSATATTIIADLKYRQQIKQTETRKNLVNTQLEIAQSQQESILSSLGKSREEMGEPVQDIDVLKQQNVDFQDQYNRIQLELTRASEVETPDIELTGRLRSEMEELEKKIKTNNFHILGDRVNSLSNTSGELENKLKGLKVSIFSDRLNNLADAMGKLVDSIRKTQQQFGITASQAASLKFQNLGASIDSYISALLPGGEAGAPVTPTQIAEAQAAFQAEFGGIISTEAATQFAQRAVEEGITVPQQAMARRLFMTMTGDRAKAIEQETRFIKQFENANMTAKDAMEALTKNSELFARNGTRFADQFVRAAIEAKKIGIDLGKIDQVGDNIIDNFEGFLESQAELGAMGFGLDPSRLAEISITGDTAALANELQAQLRATGKDLFNLNRAERLALESAFGMTISEMQRLVTGKGAGETQEDLLKKNNTFLNAAVNWLAGTVGALGTANAFLSIIAKNTYKGGGGIPGLFSGIRGDATMTRAARAMAGAKFGAGTGALTGLISGFGEYQETGSLKAGLAKGLATMAGSVIGGSLGSLIPLPGVGTLLGSMAGAWAGGWLYDAFTKGDDVISRPGYGERMLVTPTQAIALNDKDNVVAYANDMVSNAATTGVQMLSYGELGRKAESQASPVINLDLGRVEAKLDDVIRAIGSMKVEMDGTSVGKILGRTESRASTYGPTKTLRRSGVI